MCLRLFRESEKIIVRSGEEYSFRAALEKWPVLCVLIEREPTKVIIRTVVPVFIVVCIALGISGIKASSEAEYGAAATSLLTVTALYYTVQQSLPKQSMPYLAWADVYFMVRLCPIR